MDLHQTRTSYLDELFASNNLGGYKRQDHGQIFQKEIMERGVNFGVRQLPLFNHLQPDKREKATAFERSRWKRIEY